MRGGLVDVLAATCGYRGKPIVSDVSFSIGRGEVVCLLGPNGAGKTTLFKALLGFIKLLSGEIRFEDRPLEGYSARELARHIAYVPQAQSQALPFAVLDVVTMGRCARLGALASPGPADYRIAEACMEELGIARLSGAIYSELSGGERQMVLVARAIAQEPELLVMDEPTSNLDFGNQVGFLKAAMRLAASGIGIVMTTHFPDHAFLAADRVVAMRRGKIAAIGTPDAVLDEALLRSLYGVDVRVAVFDDGGVGTMKTCIPVLEEKR